MIFIVLFLSMRRSILADPMGWFINELLILPGIIIGLSFHEYAHGMVAYKLGDPTPKMQGRLTINPKAHIDPVGFIALIFCGFGWGKPVQVNPYNFKNRRRSELLVSLAGVVLNLIIAVIFSIVFRLCCTNAIMQQGTFVYYLAKIVVNIISINLVLMFFNLIPIPPLDGFGIITEIFDLRKYEWYQGLYNNGSFILLLCMVFNITGKFLSPLVTKTLYLLLF